MKDKHTREEFLEALFGGYYDRKGNFILVRSTKSLELSGKVSYYPNISSLASARFPDDVHVFFGVCPREKMSPEKEQIRYLTALWAGLDGGPGGFSGSDRFFSDPIGMEEAVESFPLKPSAVVRSGKGIHLYWFLKETKEIADASALESLLSRLNGYFGCIRPIGIDSMMRLPGTFNPKYYGVTGQCRVERFDPSLRYRGRDFAALKLPDPRVVEQKSPTTVVAHHGVDGGNGSTSLKKGSAAVAVKGTSNGHPVQKSERPREQRVPDVSQAGMAEGSPHMLSNEAIVLIADRIVDKLGPLLADRIVDAVSDRVMERMLEKVAGDSRTNDGTK